MVKLPIQGLTGHGQNGLVERAVILGVQLCELISIIRGRDSSVACGSAVIL